MIDKPKEDGLPPEINLHQEIGLQAGREGTTPEMTTIGNHPAGTQDSTRGRKVETTPEEMGDMKREIVTLAMVGDAEGPARRP